MNIQEILLDKAVECGFRAWFSNKYNQPSRVSLKHEKMLFRFDDAIEEANHLDCIYFKGDMFIPGIFKVCENDNFIEGLYHLKTIQGMIPGYYISYFLIAEDYLEKQISLELKKPVFLGFDVTVIPTSIIETISFHHHTYRGDYQLLVVNEEF